MSQPVRRGPGRPRKNPVTAPLVGSTPEQAVEEVAPPAEKASDDPRIGQECPVDWSAVGYGDGTSYLCKDGKIVERVL
jgi:hypothetical protein